jgi:hypothetical protein
MLEFITAVMTMTENFLPLVKFFLHYKDTIFEEKCQEKSFAFLKDFFVEGFTSLCLFRLLFSSSLSLIS